MRIYVASSWRNPYQQEIVALCRSCGHEVYDFRHPVPGNNGFHWGEIDPEWQDWSLREYVKGLEHPVAEQGFGLDMAALKACDMCLLVQPCGKSAHLELGYAVGAGKRTAILLSEYQFEPELMYKMADMAFASQTELKGALLELARLEKEGV